MAPKSPKPTVTTTKKAAASPKSVKSVKSAKTEKPAASPKAPASPPPKAASPGKTTSPAPSASPTKRKASEISNEKPKKATTAYFAWLNSVGRKDIIAKEFKGDGSNVAAVSKAAGVAWGKMSDAEKKPYVEIAEKDKARYQKEMATYVPSETSEPSKKKGKKGKKGKKDPNKPKRGKSAFIIFGQDVRAEVIKTELKGDGSKVTEVMKAVGARWAKVDAKTKEKYEALAAKDKERYEKEMEEYKKNNGGDDDEEDEEDEE